MATKYTKEILEEAVKNSISYAGVLRYMGLRQAGGTQSHIKRMITKYEIDVSHFKLQGWNKGLPSPKRIIDYTIFLKIYPEDSRRVKGSYLKRALLQLGVTYECSECGNPARWNGRPLVLDVDHINGHWFDNRESNLRFLCPNCHSQCETNKSWKYAGVVK